jgi:hypothetical protein
MDVLHVELKLEIIESKTYTSELKNPRLSKL